MSIHTYMCMAAFSLVPVAGWSRWASPPSKGRPKAWRLNKVSFQAILLRGGRLTARSLHHSLYLWARRSRTQAVTGLLSTLKLCGACLLVYLLPSPVSAHVFCVATFDFTYYYTLPAVSLAASTRRLNRCPRAQAKSAFPNASGRINLEN